MGKVIRYGVFETNSSSTHSLTMCTKEEYERWRHGETVLTWEKKFIPVTNEALEDEDNYTFDRFWDEKAVDYETFEEEKNGVVAFGYYGQDW